MIIIYLSSAGSQSEGKSLEQDCGTPQALYGCELARMQRICGLCSLTGSVGHIDNHQPPVISHLGSSVTHLVTVIKYLQ